MEATLYLPISRNELVFLSSALRYHQHSRFAKDICDRIVTMQTKNEHLTPHDIVIRVCDLRGCTVADINSKKRKREFSDTRACACKMVKLYFPFLSLEAIGRTVNRDHATVLRYYRNILEVKEVSEMFADLRRRLEI